MPRQDTTSIRPIGLLGLPSLRQVLWGAAAWVVMVPSLWAKDVPFHAAPPGATVADLAKKPGGLGALPVRPAPSDLVDAGDFYTLQNGTKVPLLRAQNSVAVRFAPGVNGAAGVREMKGRKDLPAHEETGRASFGKKGAFHLLRSHEKGASLDPKAVQNHASVAYAHPVLVDPKTKMRMIPTDEVLVRFREGTTATAMAAAIARSGLQLVSEAKPGKVPVAHLRLRRPKTSNPLLAARTLAAMKDVVWAQPNFVREIRHFFTPSNPLFPDQQALQNTGQNGAVAGAHVDAVHAWDKTTGNGSIVIAIIDDGVDISHPGLHIFTNPGESGGGKETNGADDDGNGLIDDVHGWDFANGDNDVTPVGTNGHGTGTAGIAGGTFGSLAQAAGIAPGCTILPVKIADDTGTFTTDDVIGEAIIYATQFADVLSNSWGGGGQSPYIDDAINYAVTLGRNGKGCPVFFATGNYASTWYSGGGRYRLSTATLSGPYYYGFYYRKGLNNGGEDTVRIDNVCLLDADGYTHKTGNLLDEDFESFIGFDPFLITKSGLWQYLTSDATVPYWSITTTNALTGTGGAYSAASPPLVNKGDYSVLVSPPFSVTGVETVAFAGSISIADDSDFYVLVFDGNSGSFLGAYGPWNGAPDVVDPNVGYPASNPQTIAVGAATDCDLRSDYSEYLGHLDFLAPSNGGWNDIATLDPVGAVGWTPDDYKLNFGGTSAATPLAAGIAALMLSRNPDLKAEEIRTLMQLTCDQVGGVTYGSDGTHPMYGHGRVNAARAVSSALTSVTINDVTVAEGQPGTTGTATFTLQLSAPTIWDVTMDVSVTDGTAIAGTNYSASPATLTIPAGATSVTYPVSIMGGVLRRHGATFTVNVANVTHAKAGGPATGVILPLDSDGDGMPDYWEVLNGFDPHDPSDGALDSDNDGVSNRDEYQFGTDPHDPASRFSVASPQASTGGMVIRFNTGQDRTYRVEYKNNLNDPLWLPLGADIPGTGAPVEVTDPVSTDVNPTRFYHVRVLP